MNGVFDEKCESSGTAGSRCIRPSTEHGANEQSVHQMKGDTAKNTSAAHTEQAASQAHIDVDFVKGRRVGHADKEAALWCFVQS